LYTNSIWRKIDYDNYICIPLLRKIKDLLYETRIVIVEYNSLFSYLMNVLTIRT